MTFQAKGLTWRGRFDRRHLREFALRADVAHRLAATGRVGGSWIGRSRFPVITVPRVGLSVSADRAPPWGRGQSFSSINPPRFAVHRDGSRNRRGSAAKPDREPLAAAGRSFTGAIRSFPADRGHRYILAIVLSNAIVSVASYLWKCRPISAASMVRYSPRNRRNVVSLVCWPATRGNV